MSTVYAASKNKLTALLLFLVSFYPLFAQNDTIRLIFTGDIMGHGAQIKSAEIKPGEYNYSPCFEHVRPLIESADIAVGNLELTLPGKPPYTGYPMFRSPDALAETLKDVGFDIIVTANNHSNDSRGKGVISTIETLRGNGFWQTGTFKNAREREMFYPLIVYQEGFKLAILNYTYGTNGVPTDTPTIVNLLDTTLMARDLADARARKPDYTIVVAHWGLEYQLAENAEQRQLARFMIDHGADLIVGMHPHVVQPARMELGAGGRQVLTAYSLGNFISNQQQPHTDGGIMLQVELIKPHAGQRAVLGRWGYIPVWRYIHTRAGGKSSYHVLPVALFESGLAQFEGMPAASREKMLRFAADLRKRLGAMPEWR
jgi:poly-gamma-glutamate capsule biosynthesis protein CapA/YwtB (metallophosphatase superfamily)